MFLAEFAFTNTTELANELLIHTESPQTARQIALDYASNWGLELFALTPANAEQVKLYSRLGKALVVH